MRKGNKRALVAEMVAALMWGPKTRIELSEITGAHEYSVRLWLSALRDAGVVSRSEERVGMSFQWSMNAKPFTPVAAP